MYKTASEIADRVLEKVAQSAVQPQVTPANALRDRWMAEQEAAGRTFRDMSPEEKLYMEALLGPGAKPPQPPMRTPQADVEASRNNSEMLNRFTPQRRAMFEAGIRSILREEYPDFENDPHTIFLSNGAGVRG